MDNTIRASILGCALAAASFAGAATINGTFTYDGQAVDSVFTDITGGSVLVENHSDDTSVYGLVDVGAGTFTIEDVTVGQSISIFLNIDRSQPANGFSADAHDLYAIGSTTVVGAGDTVDVALELRYIIQFTAPLDSTDSMNGYFNQCPVGAEVTSPTSVMWSAVPRSSSYTVTVRRRACNHDILGQEVVEQTATSLAVTLGTLGEDHLDVSIQCTGSAGTGLCMMPYVSLLDTTVQGYFLHAGNGSGRGTDHADGYMVPAVARVAGVPPTFWSSELTIVNLDDASQEIELVFTPRDDDGWTVYESAEVTLPARSARTWNDVLDEVFTIDGAGSLEVRGSDLVVSTRTSTPADGGGSFGLGVPPLVPSDLLSVGGTTTAFAGGLRDNAGWRTNFGACETSGKTVTFKVTIYDGQMNPLGERGITLGPYENTQINRVVRALTGLNDRAGDIIGVQVLAGTGTIGAYLTVIETTTGDSVYVPIRGQTATGG